MSLKEKVVVIGGGPAGLTAAYELLRDGGNERYDVTVLEATREFGGISRTVKHNGNRMDIGGHRFFSKDSRVMDWWQHILPLQGAPSYDDKKLGRHHDLAPGGPDPEQTDEVMLLRNRVSRIYWNKHFLDYPISLSPALFKAMGPVLTVRAGMSYLHSAVHKLPEDNLENFYINRFGKVLYSLFFEAYTEKLWGRHPSKISADWGAQRVKGLSITAVLKNAFSKMMPDQFRDKSKIETSLIEEFRYPKLGPGQLWELVADRIVSFGGTILTDANAVELTTDHGKISGVVIARPDGTRESLPADYVISSMPLKDLADAINAGTPVPDDIMRIAHGLPYRDFVTVGILVKHLRLENTTDMPTLGKPPIVPDNWIYVQDPGFGGRFQIFNNWSPYLVNDPDNNVWIGLEYFCDEGDDFWNLSDEEASKFATEELIRMGIIKSADDVLDSHREYVQKAYPAYFDTYYEIDKLIEYLDSFGNLYCVGRNGQHRYNNQDHSMATSFETVENIQTGKQSKWNVWSVNTEQTYHETKDDGPGKTDKLAFLSAVRPNQK